MKKGCNSPPLIWEKSDRPIFFFVLLSVTKKGISTQNEEKKKKIK